MMSDKILSFEKDKTGTEVAIKLSKSLSFSPAYLFFLKQQVQLIENGHGFPVTSWNDQECGVLYAEDNGKILGIIVYDFSEIKTYRVLSIVLTAVENDARGRGIYSIMHKWFEEVARREGCLYIKATVSPKNEVRMKTCEAAGMFKGFQLYYKKVADE
jgi:GNAT superfamily N-acetyltransferase